MPLGYLALGALQGTLGANPIEHITRSTGIWTLRFMLITLAVTPIRRLAGWNDLVRVRRMLGLFAFFYGSLHLVTYVWLDQFFDWAAIVKDVSKRPFITAGFSAYVLLVPLALTSTAGMIRRLGGRRVAAPPPPGVCVGRASASCTTGGSSSSTRGRRATTRSCWPCCCWPVSSRFANPDPACMLIPPRRR